MAFPSLRLFLVSPYLKLCCKIVGWYRLSFAVVSVGQLEHATVITIEVVLRCARSARVTLPRTSQAALLDSICILYRVNKLRLPTEMMPSKQYLLIRETWPLAKSRHQNRSHGKQGKQWLPRSTMNAHRVNRRHCCVPPPPTSHWDLPIHFSVTLCTQVPLLHCDNVVLLYQQRVLLPLLSHELMSWGRRCTLFLAAERLQAGAFVVKIILNSWLVTEYSVRKSWQ